MRTAYCQDCRTERKFKLFLDVTQVGEARVEVLGGCEKCYKGRWIEMTPEQFEEEKKEESNVRRKAG